MSSDPVTGISYEESIGELKNLIGLEEAKENLENLFNQIRVYGPQEDRPLHMVFSGNPGTGKTEVAQLIGPILHSLGRLKRGHIVHVNRSDLVAGFIGQTAIKTREKCEEALDGVLFIDEAYSLVNTEGNTSDKFPTPFDKEAYETLIMFMDDHRDRICVIRSGYQ